MVRNVSICIFASVAVLLFSSDARAVLQEPVHRAAAVAPGMRTTAPPVTAAVAAPATAMSAVRRRGYGRYGCGRDVGGGRAAARRGR